MLTSTGDKGRAGGPCKSHGKQGEGASRAGSGTGPVGDGTRAQPLTSTLWQLEGPLK